MTGACECIGYLGPLLGGGHGFLQGLHGYVADNLIEARVVLYNGTVVVASTQSNTDLFWALRGAGHNFGIVSQVTVQIYDVPKNDIWYYATFLYPGSSVSQIFHQLDNIKRNIPVQFHHYIVFGRVPAIDPVNVSILKLWFANY